ncbi:hypothetical protein CAXC1_310029 [Candidatus Xenohaliotis californiensis]|uniref:Uncharacterized protein n=1 Tax=Candidatus Xenohaliotis californiensis TaxID=84677 RepID=A0ABM9N8D1_9RICK|nr:hypothetical protein CAXC1_310029 [Candidatus Xenohaliotis californiensis]
MYLKINCAIYFNFLFFDQENIFICKHSIIRIKLILIALPHLYLNIYNLLTIVTKYLNLSCIKCMSTINFITLNFLLMLLS